ncbi:MAG: hypothetical protein ACON37_08250 [Candidatus Puniceispirillaceae bacterium]
MAEKTSFLQEFRAAVQSTAVAAKNASPLKNHCSVVQRATGYVQLVSDPP